MTPQRINIAIAEVLEWTSLWIDSTGQVRGTKSTDYENVTVPHFSTSLDACAEFEKLVDRTNYVYMLYDVCNPLGAVDGDFDQDRNSPQGWRNAIYASSLQRCEAFLRFYNKWEES